MITLALFSIIFQFHTSWPQKELHKWSDCAVKIGT